MNLRIKSHLIRSVSIIMMTALTTADSVQAQEPPPPAEEVAEQDPAPMEQASPEMREMASAMKSMADMCRMMMEQQMESRPYLLTAGLSVGSLLVISLVLFIVLEVQWIRFWSIRIKTERRKLE